MSRPVEQWVDEVLAGNTRALARAITAVENRAPESRELLRRLFPHSGKASIIGLTGAPGAGKSTLADQLAREFRKLGQTVGVVAVDPTSPFSGGAILGDRIRMQRHHADQGIYIRSMATRGALGGLAAATSEVALLLDASGRQTVLIETVGVGQDEIDIVRLADITLVVLVPGMGDDVQSLKAGLMEIADIFVINKCDRTGAEQLERGIRGLLSAGKPASGEARWVPPIIKTVASEGKGTGELAQAIADFRQYLRTSGVGARRRVENWQRRLVEMLRSELMQRLAQKYLSDGAARGLAAEIAAGRKDPYAAVEEILARIGVV